MTEKTTPIERMAALLAEMTERAMEAERQRDAARDDADQWYINYRNKAAELSEAEAKLAAQVKENEELRGVITEYMQNTQKGETENE